MINYKSNGKVLIILLIVVLMTEILLYKNEFFPPDSHSKNKIEVDLDLSNYATKSELKNVIGFDASEFDKKTCLAKLKSEVEELDVDRLKNVPSSLNDLKAK